MAVWHRPVNYIAHRLWGHPPVYEQGPSGWSRDLREVGGIPASDPVREPVGHYVAGTHEYRVVMAEVSDLGLPWPPNVIPETWGPWDMGIAPE